MLFHPPISSCGIVVLQPGIRVRSNIVRVKVKIRTSYHFGPLSSFLIRSSLSFVDCSEFDAGSNLEARRVRSDVRGMMAVEVGKSREAVYVEQSDHGIELSLKERGR